MARGKRKRNHKGKFENQDKDHRRARTRITDEPGTSITDERGDPVPPAGNGERSYTPSRTALPIQYNGSDSTSTTPDEGTLDKLPLHLDACHSCAMRTVGIDDNGSRFSEGYLDKRRRVYHAHHAGRIPPQGKFRLGLNELGGEECSLCGPDGVYRGSACSRSSRRKH